MKPKDKSEIEEVKKTDIPEEEPFKIPWKVGEIYTDVKVVKIDLKVERSVHFVTVERDQENRIKAVEKTNKKGEVVGYSPVWDSYVRKMTPKDFSRLIEGKIMTGVVIPF